MCNCNTAFEDLEDVQLTELAQHGCCRAFAEIIQRYYPRLYQIARAVLSSPYEAQEVMRDSMLKAYYLLPEFNGNTLLLTWLCRIVTDASVDRYKQKTPPDITLEIPAITTELPQRFLPQKTLPECPLLAEKSRLRCGQDLVFNQLKNLEPLAEATS